MGLQEKIAQVKQAAPLLAATSLEQRNKAYPGTYFKPS